MAAVMPAGLPHGACRNYNVMGVGFDFEEGIYIGGCLGAGFPEEFKPKDLDCLLDSMKLYSESRRLGVGSLDESLPS